ncbi:DNase I-like protein [Thozetella sp. PMI_491]|nr:DNase I-like protein [Thozetella sp. PMI_491]
MTRKRPSPECSGTIPLRLITFNVRYATPSPVPGEELWSVRCPKLCAQLKFVTSGHPSAFICLQEVLHSQLQDIEAHLGPSWGRIGCGREDGKQAGEFSPIFFRLDTWRCERNRTYWLSTTPDVPSRGWDAALERVVTTGLFRHRQFGTEAVVMATHLDHVGVAAREESAKLLLRLAGAWADGGDADHQLPVLLGGDFNSTPDDAAYQTLTAPDSGMDDVSYLVPEEARYGNQEITYTSFGEPGEIPKRIDFIFVRQSGGIKFSTFGILSNRFDDGVFLSDHRAVVTDMELPAEANCTP